MSHVRFYRRTKPYDSAGGLGKISQHRRRRTLPLKRDQVSGEKPPDGTAGQGIFNEVTLNTQGHTSKSHDGSGGQGIFVGGQAASESGQGKNSERAAVVRVNRRQKPTSNRGGYPVGSRWMARGWCGCGFSGSGMGEESDYEVSDYE